MQKGKACLKSQECCGKALRKERLKMTNILVCDDDKEIVEAIEIYLAQEGYHVIKAYDGEQAIRALKTNEVHLLIIDVMMPRLDGIHATLKIREYSSIPIIILSAKSEDADKILGLNIGADDYVTKPFNPLELVARVKSHLRRYTQLGNLNSENNAIFRAGGLVINDETKEVTVDDEPVKLTPIEYNILLLLVKTRAGFFLSTRFTKVFGKRKLSAQIIRWQSISVISGKK